MADESELAVEIQCKVSPRDAAHTTTKPKSVILLLVLAVLKPQHCYFADQVTSVWPYFSAFNTATANNTVHHHHTYHILHSRWLWFHIKLHSHGPDTFHLSFNTVLCGILVSLAPTFGHFSRSHDSSDSYKCSIIAITSFFHTLIYTNYYLHHEEYIMLHLVCIIIIHSRSFRIVSSVFWSPRQLLSLF